MPSKHDPADSLAAIIENAERIAGYIADMDRAGLERSGLVRDAVERCLERVCEAAHRLGGTAAELMPEQPWSDIRGMATGSGTPTTASVSKWFGTQSRSFCRRWRMTRNERWNDCDPGTAS